MLGKAPGPLLCAIVLSATQQFPPAFILPASFVILPVSNEAIPGPATPSSPLPRHSIRFPPSLKILTERILRKPAIGHPLPCSSPIEKSSSYKVQTDEIRRSPEVLEKVMYSSVQDGTWTPFGEDLRGRNCW